MATGPVLSRNPWNALLAIATAFLWLPAAASAADATAAEGARRSMTRQIPAGGRDGSLSPVREDEYGGLRTGGGRDGASAAASDKAGTGSASSRAASNDFWFYSADVVLFNDDDGDGYFHGIDLLFDADTYYDVADVYAVAFLSYEGGPWNEYAATDTFTLFGATSDDEFVIVTELTSGYPAGSYDLLIELYDAVDGAFLTSFGPSDTSELAFLPIEDFDRDAPFDDDVIVGGHGGGSASALTIGALLLFLMRPGSLCTSYVARVATTRRPSSPRIFRPVQSA